MSTQHTPGPWTTRETQEHWGRINVHIEGSDGFELACAYQRTTNENKANARLIAAAPELLAELKNARAYIQEHHDSFVETATNLATGLIKDPEDVLIAEASQDLLNGIDAALAKSTGGAA